VRLAFFCSQQIWTIWGQGQKDKLAILKPPYNWQLEVLSCNTLFTNSTYTPIKYCEKNRVWYSTEL